MVKTLTSLVNPVRAAAPAGPVAGQMYFNDTDDTLYWYSGTAWVPSRGANDVDWTNLTYVSGSTMSSVPQYRIWNGMLQARFQAGTTLTTALSPSSTGSITDIIFSGIPVGARSIHATTYFPVMIGGCLCTGCLTVNGEVRIVVADARGVAYTIAIGGAVVGVSPLYPAGL